MFTNIKIYRCSHYHKKTIEHNKIKIKKANSNYSMRFNKIPENKISKANQSL